MKQSADQRPVLNLDDLERQLREAAEPKRTFSDDPLAELARIVKQDDPLRSVGGASTPAARAVSFDDFLKAPPRSASGVMPEHTPRIEPLFADFEDLKKGKVAEDVAHSEELIPSIVDKNALETAASTKDADFDDLLELTEKDEAPVELRSALKDDFSVFEDEFGLEAAVKSAEEPSAIVSDAPTFAVEEPLAEKTAEKPPGQFDDMLAEFEAAMRDAGGDAAVQRPVPSLEPVVVPPPPAETTYGGPSLSGVGMGAAAAAAGAVAMGMAGSAASQAAPANDAGYAAPAKPAKSRRGLMIAAGVVGVAIIGMGSLLGMGSGMRKAAPVNAPVIAAKPGVTKERPANPGGVEVPNQDKEVLQSRPQTAAVERVAPREEQPVDLAQAQRRVQTTAEAPSSAPAVPTSNGVRQIPGVAIVAPVSTTPPAGSVPAVAPVPAPRPVASVPITIAGQPAPAAPPVVAPVPAVSAPAPAPSAAAAPAPLTPSTSAPVAAPPLRTAAVAPAPAEPRRVRAVPIRPEGEPAPSRAQAQPRIVPAAPPAPGVRPAPEPDDANAPLRITPAANRAQPQRVASAQPAAAAPAERTTGSTGNFTVQLAAEGSSDAARSKFNRIRGQHSSVIGSYDPDIRTAEVNGRNVYRVRVGSFSREEAVSVCERLKANGGTCFVARN
ncbi:MAG: SPOR domain-containing protein [Beijerinckiaceae bacterium]